ncbi:MAG: arginase family protein [Bacteroidales bacterium]|jgi:arginase family enzyme|nr:arginase family protein [Bacteroidales bacterium]MDD2264777.1 arginase family protein [Bacteroidales bacterium]MDD2831875.1 arginase family protein [Bacteroidales bacterium]MDD3209126.1 arginase family protein [Bacteroidales bacterium]MDD3697998.1 arginase family protein [Bacteroidales bacterium]
MDAPVIIMDFTRVYRNQSFYLDYDHVLIDCTDITGSDCYCDPEAAGIIQERIADHPVKTVHFLDSGNHHYMTKFWTDRISRDFLLVVADHHPDMQPALFEDMLSCGGWVRTVLESNPWVRQVWFIGVSDQYPIPRNNDTIIVYPDRPRADLPAYLSIDKDILDPRTVTTNWDQGTMSYRQLHAVIREIMHRHPVLGVDICGECTTCIDSRSDLINGRLLSCIAGKNIFRL